MSVCELIAAFHAQTITALRIWVCNCVPFFGGILLRSHTHTHVRTAQFFAHWWIADNRLGPGGAKKYWTWCHICALMLRQRYETPLSAVLFFFGLYANGIHVQNCFANWIARNPILWKWGVWCGRCRALVGHLEFWEPGRKLLIVLGLWFVEVQWTWLFDRLIFYWSFY